MAEHPLPRLSRSAKILLVSTAGVTALAVALWIAGSRPDNELAAGTSSSSTPATTRPPAPPPTPPPSASSPTPVTPTPTPTKQPSPKRQSLPSGVSLGGCPNLPSNNIWHAEVSRLPLHARSSQYVAGIGAQQPVKADFGSGLWDGGPIGIPVTYVDNTQRRVPVSFDYADDSDRGPYPIPAAALVEGGASSDGDRHVLVVDRSSCKLYELWDAHPRPDGSWHAGSGAIFDLRGSKLRPKSWTSADAAGLPITPGLVRYDEVAAGHIDHAIRVTVPKSQNAYLWPARHAASSSSDKNLPPMGLRLRLKAGTDLTQLPKQARIVAEAMRTYGVIVADNGSAWYISGVPDPRWNNDALSALGSLHGNDFEAVDTTGLIANPNSSQALGH
jgi:hypothetical protein